MKKIYEYTLFKDNFIDKPIDKIVDGKEIKVLEKVNEKIPTKYFIGKPGREFKENAELFYSTIFWQCQKLGIMPMTQIQRRLIDDGGILTKEDNDWREATLMKLWATQAEHKALTDKPDKTEEDDKKIAELMDNIVKIFTDLQEFDGKHFSNDLYQNTAEYVAKTRQNRWWTMFLTQKDLGDNKQEPVFGAGSYEDRLKVYDSIMEGDDEYNKSIVERAELAISLWSFGKAETQEDFDLLIQIHQNQGLIQAVQIANEINKDKDSKETPKEDLKEEKIEELKDKSPEIKE